MNSMNNTISRQKLQELLERTRAAKNANRPALAELQNLVKERRPDVVDFSGTGISNIHTPEGEEATVDFIQEITSNDEKTPPILQVASNNKTGVAAKVSLNEKQELFRTKILQGQDCCLLGAAGTGKTTCTGQAIRSLIDSDQIGPLGSPTKVLSATSPGILVCSYTRKAVNNIKRAVPVELIGNTLTLHKVLEFQPEFYEIQDEKTGEYKSTMKFVPKRTKLNPLPPGLKLVIFEESSMIGTDLYNLYKDATPHLPQEIFIGDIQQLPPIFGPAILGFKMALLPIVELTEVYRQALQSPIIRLAHAILSGNPHTFSKTIKTREEIHPDLGKKVVRKYCPSLETFNEDSEHGIVQFQLWQKKQQAEIACYATVQQFIAWHKRGYYSPYRDIILCPFNKAFGTVELNKGILQYLGKLRNATVHEIIAGFNKHYYAEGDRVLYDKEDAIITSIKRNTAYIGKSPQPASVDMDRSGSYTKELTAEEAEAAAKDELNALSGAEEDFLMDQFSSNEEGDDRRVNQASHAITIKFTYSSEEMELRTAGEVNSLLGGHAITVHKFQGSEEEAVFLVLHSSHAVMVQRELLYTAVTRARKKLHIICDSDTFFNGVKSQKVKGTTLEQKIEYFKGKGTFEEMQNEMMMLKAQKQARERIRLKELENYEKQRKMKLTVAPEIPETLSVPEPQIMEKKAPTLTLSERLAAIKYRSAGK